MAQQIADVLGAFKARERTVALPTDGALLAERDPLAERVQSARVLGGVDEAAAVRLAEIDAQLAETAVQFRLRGVGRNAFRRLMAEHPGADGDMWGDGFPAALIAACSLDPVMTVTDVQALGDVLTDGQWSELFDAAFSACREVDGVPFS